jgi:hypothetical protein
MQRAAALAIGILSPKLVVNADSTTGGYHRPTFSEFISQQNKNGTPSTRSGAADWFSNLDEKNQGEQLMLLRGCFYPDGLPVRDANSRTTQGAFDGVHELVEEEVFMLDPPLEVDPNAAIIANGDCNFDSMATSAHFTRTMDDFEGNALDGSGQWYSAVQPFPGKENTLYYPVDLTAITGGSQGLTIQEAKKWCVDTAPTNDCTRTHLSCPSSADENFYLWWHHPNQPFNYPHSIGIWLGIERNYDLTNGYSDWTCDGLPQDYYNWRMGGMSNKTSANLIEYYAHVRYTVDNWEDYHGNGFFNKAHFYCEMTYTPDCEKTIGDDSDPTDDPDVEEFPDKLNNTLFDYGCFCQRAFGGSKTFRGSHLQSGQAADNLDSICQTWYLCERCMGIEMPECSSLGNYDYEITYSPDYINHNCTADTDCARTKCECWGQLIGSLKGYFDIDLHQSLDGDLLTDANLYQLPDETCLLENDAGRGAGDVQCCGNAPTWKPYDTRYRTCEDGQLV